VLQWAMVIQAPMSSRSDAFGLQNKLSPISDLVDLETLS
jgi:hypothetical protein